MAALQWRQHTVKALIVDKFQPSGISELKSIGVDVVYNTDITADTLPALVEKEDPDVLIVRSTKVLPPVFEKARRLTLVVRAGAGVDNIDVPAASARGISVVTCTGKNSMAVAGLGWGLILAAVRRVAERTRGLRGG
jgi:D-3-phosphoglycerate dehydrogenase